MFIPELKDNQNAAKKTPDSPRNGSRFLSDNSGARTGVKQDKDLKFLKGKESVSGSDIFFMGAVGVGFIGAYILYRRLTERMSARDTGGLATKAEAEEAYGYSYGRGGYLLGRHIEGDDVPPAVKIWNQIIDRKPANLWLKLEDRFRMTKIQASTGAGKTTQFIVPQIIEDAYSSIFNVYVIDRKPPELAAMTAGVWEANGHRVIHFNPWIGEVCWGYEPLYGATPDEIEAMVEVLIPISHIEDSTWLYRISDRDIVRTVFRAAQIWGKKDRSLATLPAVAKLFKQGVLATREAIESTGDRDLIDGIQDVWGYQTGELSKMWRGLAGRFSFFIEDEDVARAFSRSDFTMRDLITPIDENPKHRTILYVGASQSKGDRSRKIASLLTRLLTIEAFRRGDEMRLQGKKWQDIVPLWMCLDERGTYYIPEEDDSLATFRSLGVAVTIALQSNNQLIKWQGREAADTLDTNFNFYVVLGGCDLEYATKISDEIGKHWVWTKTETKGKSHESFELKKKKMESVGWRQVEQLVLEPNEIMQLPDDEAIIIGRKSVSTGRKCPPVRVKLYPFYMGAEYSQAVAASEERFLKKCNMNRRLDNSGRQRPTQEIKRLPLPSFDWRAYLSANNTPHQQTQRKGASKF